MRLWHNDLIDVLPRKQLLAQWRECCAIASNIATKGTPNHMLVNKMLEYPQIHFIEYCNRILREMKRRGYKVNRSSYERLVDNMKLGQENYKVEGILITTNIFEDWHNDRYLTQCYYNLQEKFDCGGIPEEEWNIVNKKYYELKEKMKSGE